MGWKSRRLRRRARRRTFHTSWGERSGRADPDNLLDGGGRRTVAVDDRASPTVGGHGPAVHRGLRRRRRGRREDQHLDPLLVGGCRRRRERTAGGHDDGKARTRRARPPCVRGKIGDQPQPTAGSSPRGRAIDDGRRRGSGASCGRRPAAALPGRGRSTRRGRRCTGPASRRQQDGAGGGCRQHGPAGAGHFGGGGSPFHGPNGSRWPAARGCR